MKKALVGLLALFGLAGASSAQKPVMIDPSKILFSIPTISDDEAPLEALTGKVAPDDFVFHEDDWRQIEFFPASRQGDVEKKLSELAVFEKAHRRGSGWDKIYIRRFDAIPVLSGRAALDALAADLGVPVRPAPVLHDGNYAVTGRVARGFSLPLGHNVALYGFQDSTGIAVLGASVQSDSDDPALSRAFATLNVGHHLILVDWRARVILAGVAADGNFKIWRPE